MKKNIIIAFCILIPLIALFYIIQNKDNENILDRLSKTEVIIVNKLASNVFPQEKKIFNMNEVNDVINIIQSAKEMPEDQNVPYALIPHYKLKMMDKKEVLITTINLFSYDNFSYISFDDDDLYYIIDDDLLLEIIDY